MEIIKELKGGSLSRTVVVRDGSNFFVRKYVSIHHDREYGLVRWQSQLRKLQLINQFLPNSCPNLIKLGQEDDCYFYDIPYYENYLNCYSAILSQKCSPNLMAEKVVDLLRDFASVEYGDVQGALSTYVFEEVLNPLNFALKAIDLAEIPLKPEELNYFKKVIVHVIPKVRSIISRLNNVSCKESLTHGNLTLENLLWDEDNQKLIIIDPYAETYCESLIGDVSQLLQSSQSGYEYFSEYLSGKDFSAIHYPNSSLPTLLNCFTDNLMEKLSKEKWFSEEYLLLFRASQFTRMFPFKLAKEPRLGVLFMIHGISLLSKVKC